MMDNGQLRRISYRSHLDGAERDFFLCLPRGYGQDDAKKWPVLLFLHGDGERGDGKGDLDFVLKNGPLYEAWIQKRDLPFLIISPQLPMFGRDKPGGPPYLVTRNRSEIPRRVADGVSPHTTDLESKTPMTSAVPAEEFPFVNGPPGDGWDQVEEDLVGILDLVLSGFRADAARVYLTGLSYGGWGTWYMASRHPDTFAAISPVVGWGHADLVEPLARVNMPVWAFSGGKDDRVETRYFFAGLNRLVALGATNVRFTTHQDMGHDVWNRVYAGSDLYDWLLGFHRSR
jgi:predicted peptidase